MKITQYEISEHNIELRAPFVTALRTVTSYPIIKVRLVLEDGSIGLGDCVATPAISGDSHDSILANFNSLELKELLECSYPSHVELHTAIANSSLLPSARSALDIALTDSNSKISSTSVATDVTIPICSDLEFEGIFEERVRAGFNAFKVKTDKSNAQALPSRLAQISSAGNYQIRIDPNQSWDLDLAIEVMSAIEEQNIFVEYLEQPLPRADLVGHAKLAKRIKTPLMADESVFSLEDLERVASNPIFTWLNVKLLKSGGYEPARELAERALDLGMKVSIGSMMEGEQGIRAAASLAKEIAPNLVHDLDAAWWIRNTSLTYSESILST